MGYLPFPIEAFERYVKAMPEGEAQTALIYLVNFIAEAEAARVRRDRLPDLVEW